MQQMNDISDYARECVQSFAVFSKSGCELADSDGSIIASSGSSCSSCDICCNTGIQKQDCLRLHEFTAKASLSDEGRYIYECPLGFSFVTSAVVVNQGRIMRLTLGPFLMEDKEDFRTYTLEESLKLSCKNIESIMQKIDKMAELEPAEVNAVSKLLVYSAAYLSGLQSGDDYVSGLEAAAVSEWESVNRLDSTGIIKKAIDYISEHFSESIILSDIAEYSGVTTSYLCRLFKKNTGITINTHITQLRIEKSKELLSQNVPIADVARLCGFSDQSYFTKVFRQSEGVTPLKYRKGQ